MVTNDSASQQKSLSKLKQQSSDAENDLSLLPVDSNMIETTTRFMNQLNGYCTSLIKYNDGKLRDKDYESLNKIYDSVSMLKKELNSVMDKIMVGYRISDNLSNNGENSDFSLNFTSLSNDTIEYPSLIYDGPFSDSSLNNNIKGLSQEEITESEAEELISKLFKDKLTNVSYLGLTEGKFETYDYGVNTDDNKNYFIQITKRGGFLLTMNSNISNNDESNDASVDSVNDDKNISENSEVKVESINDVNEKSRKAIEASENFAKSQNLDNMKCVWSAYSENICYVNLAPIIDDIIMYPDLVKVKVDLNNNSVVGWEASSYALNHVKRDDLIPQLSENEAKKYVSKNLKIDSEKLCVIPLDYSGETLAYEFCGTYNDYVYYVYVDADNGNQIRILRVVQTSEGELIL